jgi:hypothetical protein
VSTTILESELRDLFASGDIGEMSRRLGEMAAEQIVQEWPQSGERIRGRENVLAVNAQYEAATGTHPTLKLRRLIAPGTAWVAEATIDYGDGVPVSLVSIIETDASGRIEKETDYFASPFDAPEWRRPWAERME